jgi:hypothetical protein
MPRLPSLLFFRENANDCKLIKNFNKSYHCEGNLAFMAKHLTARDTNAYIIKTSVNL